MLEVSVQATLWHSPAAAAQRNHTDCVLTRQGWEPALPSPCPGQDQKDCQRARDSPPGEQVLALGARTFITKIGEKKSAFTDIYIFIYTLIYMYVIMLSHGETKWIGRSLAILKLGFM